MKLDNENALVSATITRYEVWDRGAVKSANDRVAVSDVVLTKNTADSTYFIRNTSKAICYTYFTFK